MSQLDVPLVNGNKHSYAEIEWSIEGDRVIGIQGIDYDDNLEPGRVAGTSAQDIGRTLGEYKASSSVTIIKASADLIRTKLGDGYGAVVYPITVLYRPSNGDPLIKDELIGVRIKKCADSHSKGPDGLVEKWDLDIMGVFRNGLHMVPKAARLY